MRRRHSRTIVGSTSREVLVSGRPHPDVVVAPGMRHDGIDKEENPVSHEEEPGKEGECFRSLSLRADSIASDAATVDIICGISSSS